MNAIIGYTNLALKEPVSPETKGYLEKVIASSQHLLALINDILEMSFLPISVPYLTGCGICFPSR